jgi:glycosyltransferase involved in cell wall biosynthesis
VSIARPKVLVVLPTLGDRLGLLERALASVDAQRSSVEVTLAVVTPRAKQAARSLAKKYGATLIDDPGRGMSAAINAGLALRTTEEFYIWLGDDDYYLPDGLATLTELFMQQREAVVAYGGCEYVKDTGEVLWTSKAGALAKVMIGVGPNLIPHPAALMRLDAVEKSGGYDESLRYAMDLDLFLTLRDHGEFVSTTTAVSAFGWQPESLTVSGRNASAREARVVKRQHLPGWARPYEPLWAYPVMWASALAAHRITKKASLANNG